MKKTKKNSVWGTRMKSEVSSVLQAANSSIEIDKRLYQEDIQGSIAHCTMLAKRKSNQLMQLRVFLQFCAIIILMALAFIYGK